MLIVTHLYPRVLWQWLAKPCGLVLGPEGDRQRGILVRFVGADEHTHQLCLAGLLREYVQFRCFFGWVPAAAGLAAGLLGWVGGVAGISFPSALLSCGRGRRSAYGEGAGLAATAWRSAYGRAFVVLIEYHYSAWLRASAVFNALVALASLQRKIEQIEHGLSLPVRRARAVLPVRLEPPPKKKGGVQGYFQ